MTVLVTAPGADEPHLAVKVATTRGGRRRDRARGASCSCELRRRPLPRVGPTLPRPAGVFDADGLLAVATSWCPACRCGPATTPSGIWPGPRLGARRLRGGAGTGSRRCTPTAWREAAPIALLDGVAGADRRPLAR